MIMGEYTGNKLDNYLKNEGIGQQFKVPYSSPQYGVEERKIRTVIEIVRCMIKEGCLPNSFWGAAICHVHTK